MWCSNCRQDVPGVALPNRGGKFCCARCGEQFFSESDSEEQTVAAEEKSDESLDDSSLEELGEDLEYDLVATGTDDTDVPVDLDDWRLDEDLAATERLIRSVRARRQAAADEIPKPDYGSFATHEFDDNHASTQGWHVHAVPQNHLSQVSPARGAEPRSRAPKHAVKPAPREDSSRGSMLAWGALAVGLMAFVCGGVLLGWGFASSRADLWSLGTPLTLVGVASLLLGMVLQMDGLWQSSRQTADMLDDLDDQLHDLRHTTTLMGTTRSAPAQSFYSHMAEGAGPQMLLADLKSQLDMLAVKMSRER